ncbi:hypothetical protein BDR06DRAFT_826093, partial [Suillus hirtellus]
HKSAVNAVAVFPNKQRKVTPSDDQTLRLWDFTEKTGESLTQSIKTHSITLVDFSPDGT